MIGIYFSGTGNSKYAVETFMKNMHIKDCTYSIENERVVDEIKNSQTIIFSYPVQYSAPPKFVRDFITNNAILWKDKHLFVIATFGLFSGDGSGVLARLLRSNGAIIIGGLHLKMPDSIADERVLKRSFEKNKALIHKASIKIENSANAFQQNKPTQEGLHIISRCLGGMSQRALFGYKTKRYHKSVKINKDTCISCKKCIEFCPLQNFVIQEKQIKTNGKCTLCYRCVNACPKQAITILGKKVIKQTLLSIYLNSSEV